MKKITIYKKTELIIRKTKIRTIILVGSSTTHQDVDGKTDDFSYGTRERTNISVD